MIVIDYDRAFAKMSQHPAFRNQYDPPWVASDAIDAPRPRDRPGGWNDDDYDVLGDGEVVGRIGAQLAKPGGRRGVQCGVAHSKSRYFAENQGQA